MDGFRCGVEGRGTGACLGESGQEGVQGRALQVWWWWSTSATWSGSATEGWDGFFAMLISTRPVSSGLSSPFPVLLSYFRFNLAPILTRAPGIWHRPPRPRPRLPPQRGRASSPASAHRFDLASILTRAPSAWHPKQPDAGLATASSSDAEDSSADGGAADGSEAEEGIHWPVEGMASSVDEEGVSRPAGGVVDSAGIMTDGGRGGLQGGGGVEKGGAPHTPRPAGAVVDSAGIMTDGGRGGGYTEP